MGVMARDVFMERKEDNRAFPKSSQGTLRRLDFFFLVKAMIEGVRGLLYGICSHGEGGFLMQDLPNALGRGGGGACFFSLSIQSVFLSTYIGSGEMHCIRMG